MRRCLLGGAAASPEVRGRCKALLDFLQVPDPAWCAVLTSSTSGPAILCCYGAARVNVPDLSKFLLSLEKAPTTLTPRGTNKDRVRQLSFTNLRSPPESRDFVKEHQLSRCLVKSIGDDARLCCVFSALPPGSDLVRDLSSLSSIVRWSARFHFSEEMFSVTPTSSPIPLNRTTSAASTSPGSPGCVSDSSMVSNSDGSIASLSAVRISSKTSKKSNSDESDATLSVEPKLLNLTRTSSNDGSVASLSAVQVDIWTDQYLEKCADIVGSNVVLAVSSDRTVHICQSESVAHVFGDSAFDVRRAIVDEESIEWFDNCVRGSIGEIEVRQPVLLQTNRSTIDVKMRIKVLSRDGDTTTICCSFQELLDEEQPLSRSDSFVARGEWDVSTWTVRSMSRSYASLYGRSKDIERTRDCRLLIHPDDRDRVQKCMTAAVVGSSVRFRLASRPFQWIRRRLTRVQGMIVQFVEERVTQLVRAEKARKKRSDQLERASAHGSRHRFGTMFLDRHMKIRSWNLGLTELSGWKQEERVGKSIDDILLSKDRLAIRERNKGDVFSIDVQCIDGSSRRLFCASVLDEELCRLLVVSNREDELPAEVRRLTFLRKHAGDPMIDVSFDGERFRIEWTTAAFGCYHHMTCGQWGIEMPGLTEDLLQQLVLGLKKDVDKVAYNHLDMRIESFVYSRGTTTRFWLRYIFPDTLSRLRTDRGFQSNSKFMLLSADRNGVIVSVIGASKQILGLDAQEVVGRNGFDFVHQLDLDAVMQACIANNGKKEQVGQEATFRRRNELGDPVWVRNIVLQPADSDGIATYLEYSIQEEKTYERHLKGFMKAQRACFALVTVDMQMMGRFLANERQDQEFPDETKAHLLRKCFEFTYVTDSCAKLFGISKDDFKTQRFLLPHVSIEQKIASYKSVSPLYRGEEPSVTTPNMKFRHSDGKIITVTRHAWIDRQDGKTMSIFLHWIPDDPKSAQQRAFRKLWELVHNNPRFMIGHGPFRTGVLHDCMGACKEVTGYSAKELEGKNGYELMHEDDRQRILSVTKDFGGPEDAPRTVQFRRIHPSGEAKWVAAHRLSHDKETNTISFIEWSIEKEKKLERQREKLERHLQVSMESQHICFLHGTIDMKKAQTDIHRAIKYECASTSTAHLLGIQREDLTPPDFVLPHATENDDRRVKRAIAQLREKKSGLIPGLKLRKSDGTIVSVTATARRDQLNDRYMSFYLILIPEDPKSQQQHTFHFLWELVHDNPRFMIAHCNTETGEIVGCVGACKEMTGYSTEYLKGKIEYKLIHPDDVRRLSKSTGRNLSEGLGTIRYRRVHPNGRTKWVEAHRVKYDKDTKILSFIEWGIEDLKQREQENATIMEQADHLFTIVLRSEPLRCILTSASYKRKHQIVIRPDAKLDEADIMDSDRYVQEIQDFLASTNPSHEWEQQWCGKPHCHVVTYYGPTSLLIISRDLTLQYALRKKTLEVVCLREQRAHDRILRDVAQHDIKNMCLEIGNQVRTGFSHNWLGNKDGTNEVLQTIADKAREGVSRSCQIIAEQDIMTDGYKYEPKGVDQIELARQMVRDRRHVKFFSSLGNRHLVMTDENAIRSIITNYLLNAQDYGGPEPSIHLILEQDREDMVWIVQNAAGPDHESLRRDFGPTANKTTEDRCQVFFETSNHKGLRTSLSSRVGLRSVALVAKKIGALYCIRIKTSCVQAELRLPGAFGQMNVPRESSQGRCQLMSRHVIWAMDDEDYAQDDLMMLLSKEFGIWANEKESRVLGDERRHMTDFVSLVRSAVSPPTVVLLDQNLYLPPDREESLLGSDIAQALRDDGYDDVIIIRSSNSSLRDRELYRSKGADGFLDKGEANLTTMVQTIEACITRRQNRRNATTTANSKLSRVSKIEPFSKEWFEELRSQKNVAVHAHIMIKKYQAFRTAVSSVSSVTTWTTSTFSEQREVVRRPLHTIHGICLSINLVHVAKAVLHLKEDKNAETWTNQWPGFIKMLQDAVRKWKTYLDSGPGQHFALLLSSLSHNSLVVT